MIHLKTSLLSICEKRIATFDEQIFNLAWNYFFKELKIQEPAIKFEFFINNIIQRQLESESSQVYSGSLHKSYVLATVNTIFVEALCKKLIEAFFGEDNSNRSSYEAFPMPYAPHQVKSSCKGCRFDVRTKNGRYILCEKTRRTKSRKTIYFQPLKYFQKWIQVQTFLFPIIFKKLILNYFSQN